MRRMRRHWLALLLAAALPACKGKSAPFQPPCTDPAFPGDPLGTRCGRLVDTQAYSYLPSSVKRFPGPEELATVMWRSGLREIRYVLTAGGIIALHVGMVPT